MCALSLSGCVLPPALLSGCVIPPDLEEAPPAANKPPVVVRDDPENPITPTPGAVAVCEDNDLTVNFWVSDANENDTLTLRLFLDDVFAVGDRAGPTGDSVRRLNAGLPSPCVGATGEVRLLEGIVSDRGFEGEGRETADEALTATLAWLLRCLTAEECLIATDGGS